MEKRIQRCVLSWPHSCYRHELPHAQKNTKLVPPTHRNTTQAAVIRQNRSPPAHSTQAAQPTQQQMRSSLPKQAVVCSQHACMHACMHAHTRPKPGARCADKNCNSHAHTCEQRCTLATLLLLLLQLHSMVHVQHGTCRGMGAHAHVLHAHIKITLHVTTQQHDAPGGLHLVSCVMSAVRLVRIRCKTQTPSQPMSRPHTAPTRGPAGSPKSQTHHKPHHNPRPSFSPATTLQTSGVGPSL
jgi:hypothetical protein